MGVVTLNASYIGYTGYIGYTTLGMENEQADEGRDGRTCVARPKYLARTRTGNRNIFPCSADLEQDWQPYRLMPILLYVMIVQT